MCKYRKMYLRLHFYYFKLIYWSEKSYIADSLSRLCKIVKDLQPTQEVFIQQIVEHICQSEYHKRNYRIFNYRRRNPRIQGSFALQQIGEIGKIPQNLRWYTWSCVNYSPWTLPGPCGIDGKFWEWRCGG